MIQLDMVVVVSVTSASTTLREVIVLVNTLRLDAVELVITQPMLTSLTALAGRLVNAVQEL